MHLSPGLPLFQVCHLKLLDLHNYNTLPELFHTTYNDSYFLEGAQTIHFVR